MSGIDKITNGIMTGASKVLGYASKTKPMRWLGDQFQKNPENALALTTVASIVVKDGVGCYKYVTQSLNNERIPEKQRSFVAALDLTNGFLMILAQIGMFFAMKKFSEPIFNKLFKGSFNEQNAKNIATKIRMLLKKNGEKAPRKLVIDREYQKVREDALNLFKFVVDIAAATIIGKRVIVPFIATPLANKVKGSMEKKINKDKPAEAEKVENKTEKAEDSKVKESASAKATKKDDDHDDD